MFVIGSAFVLCFLLTVIAIFAFPQFSPIPYYPTNLKDIPLIVKALRVRNRKTIVDLGAGDGVVIFKSAELGFKRGLNTQFIALEINPVLVAILHIRRLFHANKKNIKIIRGDMFTYPFSSVISPPNPQSSKISQITFYLYISPWLITKAIKNTKIHCPKAEYVSYYYPLPNQKPVQINQSGIHPIYIYKCSHEKL